MAYVKVVNHPNLPFIYNVHAAVGPNSPNQRVDVLLVQHLLRVAFENATLLELKPLPSGRRILVDGVCGSITNEAILHFQKEVKAKGSKIPTDGRVDRAYPGDKTPHGLFWTIIFLNNAFRHARPGHYANLPASSDCPSEVRAALL